MIKLLDVVMYATLQSLHLWLVAFVFGFVFFFLCDDPRLNLLTWGIFILKMVRTFSCCLGWLACFLENKTATGFLLLSLSVGASGVACKYLTRHCTQTTSFHILCIIRVVFNVPPFPYKLTFCYIISGLDKRHTCDRLSCLYRCSLCKACSFPPLQHLERCSWNVKVALSLCLLSLICETYRKTGIQISWKV